MTTHVYLSGPMSGLPDYNYPAFEDATRRLRGTGFTVWSPHEEDLWHRHDDGELRAKLLDISHVALWADWLVLLPGWENSRGALAEAAVAQWCGVTVIAYSPRGDDLYNLHLITDIYPQTSPTAAVPAGFDHIPRKRIPERP